MTLEEWDFLMLECWRPDYVGSHNELSIGKIKRSLPNSSPCFDPGDWEEPIASWNKGKTDYLSVKGRQTLSKKSKMQWEDIEYQQIQSNKLKAQWEDHEFRQMQSKLLLERIKRLKSWWYDPEYRQMQSDKMKRLWRDPEYRVNHRKRSLSDKKSGLPLGVSLTTNEKKPYRARPWIAGKNVQIGNFATPEEAGDAVRTKLAELNLENIEDCGD
jgi:hypothetical protein